jgi:Xaa-Pro aminopeptidase
MSARLKPDCGDPCRPRHSFRPISTLNGLRRPIMNTSSSPSAAASPDTASPSNLAVILMAGPPATVPPLYHRVRFLVGDPTVYVEITQPSGERRRVFIVRDIEMDRARRVARVDQVACPADFAPASGLSGDRETATAQAAAEFLRREGIAEVTCDRSVALIYTHHLTAAGIQVKFNPSLGVAERRAKDSQEADWLREAQQVTEGAMRLALERIARATADRQGVLHQDGAPLTSDRLRSEIDIWLLGKGYQNPTSIVAGGPAAADCHDHGHGELRTEEPIVVDIFPCSRATRYNGDCTRTVVHGNGKNIPDQVLRMHQAVVEAKRAAVAATRAGVTGEAVHEATCRTILAHGFQMGLPPADAPPEYCGMTHGTGHGVGLEVHEPPLLDRGGPELVVGDCLTIEPGLYCRAVGGVRVEDMVLVTEEGCENFNQLPEGLDWS